MGIFRRFISCDGSRRNKGLFGGPVANKEVFPGSEFIYQIVRGPNARNDFHIDPGDEIFYQLKGDITVRCIDADGKPRDIRVREGEVMLCRAGTPHCPIRPRTPGGWSSSASAGPTSSTGSRGSARAAAASSTRRRSRSRTSRWSYATSSSGSTGARR